MDPAEIVENQPVVTPEPAPVPEPAAAEPEPIAAEPEPAPEPEQPKAPAKKPWFMERISEESHRARAAETRAEKAEREAREAKELLTRLQQAGAQPSDRVAPVTSHGPSQDELDKLIDARAEEKRFFAETTAVKNAGLQTYGQQFENDLNILTAVGATSNDMVADILAVDRANAHVTLNKLANDPEKAAILAKMDSRTRIAELTRMTMAQSQPVATAPAKPAVPPKTVSKAPPPPPPVEPTTGTQVDWKTDKNVSDAEWSRKWDEEYGKRRRRA